MKVGALIDNDVVLKVAAYRLGSELVDAATFCGLPPAMLGVGKFVVLSRIEKAKSVTDQTDVLKCFDDLLRQIILLEPSPEEVAVAAEFESAANRLNLELDGGESQLLAILLARSAVTLITGDKRAIKAIAVVGAGKADKRIACLEQLMATILERVCHHKIRERICGESRADKTLTICFACASAVVTTKAEVLDALGSYVSYLRKDAPETLVDGLSLSTLSA